LKTVVIVGEFDSDNVGDQLIGEGQVLLLSGEGWRVSSVPLEPGRGAGGAGSKARRAPWMRLVHRRLYQASILYRHIIEAATIAFSWREFRGRAGQVVAGADFIIIGGGQLFSDGTLRMMARLFCLAVEAGRAGIPIAAFGTGASAPRTFISQLLLRASLRKITSRSWLRDSKSIEIASHYLHGRALSAKPVPDCAIARVMELRASPALPVERLLVGIAPMSGASLGLSSKAVGTSNAWWTELVSILLAQGYRPTLFCTGVHSDYQRCLDIQAACAAAGNQCEVLPRPGDGADLVRVMSPMGLTLTQRLHASISCYALGKTPASLAWDPKVDQFFKMIGLGNRVIDPKTTTPQAAVRILLGCALPAIGPEKLNVLSKSMARECLQHALKAVGMSVEIPKLPTRPDSNA
jgi:polysaccharide pyruvyl transferase WcaK-like protein